MVFINEAVEDVKDVCILAFATILLGARFVKSNWTKEDSVSLAKFIAYLSLGYVILISTLLVG